GSIKFKNDQALEVKAVAASGNFAGTTNGLDTSATAGKTIDVLVSTGDLTLTDNVTTAATGNVYLTAVTGISETGTATITTGTLGMDVTGTGDIDVNNANLVDVVGAQTADGSIKFKNDQALEVKAVAASGNFAGTTNGLDTSATAGKTIDVLVSTGDLTLTDNVTTAATGNVYLTAVTGISETGTATITTGTLGMDVTGTGDLDVNNANLVDVVGAQTADGSIKFKNDQALEVKAVAASGNFAGTTNGLDTSATAGKTIDVLVSTGDLTLTDNVTTAATGNVYLTAVTGISETGTATITTGTLGMDVTGTGDLDVNNANLVDVVGA